jgi:hypothetical protein
MKYALYLAAAILGLITVVFLVDRIKPVKDPATLSSIRAEGHLLMTKYPALNDWTVIPADEWPPVIARLKPDAVYVNSSHVDIMMRHDFDGGWGYHIPRDRRHLPMPAACYSEPAPDVFWHAPC